MRIVIRYFAIARERAGTDREELEVPEATTAGGAMALLVARHPALAPLHGRLRMAVNREFGDDAQLLSEGAELALIPPVAGGGGRCGIRETALSLDEVVQRVSGPGQGGIVTFSGAVRAQSRGKRVLRLTYEAYAAMAEQELERISQAAEQRFAAEVAILHRVGQLEVGEIAVVIAASAPHREQAFDACRFAIEELKKQVPIWKKETYEDGDEWVGLGP